MTIPDVVGVDDEDEVVEIGIGGVPLLDIGGVGNILPFSPPVPTVLLLVGVSPPRFRQTFHHPALSFLSFSSRLLSNADLYRSYPSLKPLSTLEENISSPRGFEDGGIEGMMPLLLGLRSLELRVEAGAIAAGVEVDEDWLN